MLKIVSFVDLSNSPHLVLLERLFPYLFRNQYPIMWLVGLQWDIFNTFYSHFFHL